VFGTAEGSVGVFIPVHEKLFRRLYTLQSIMINALPHHAGLNPREFRQAPHAHKSTGRPDAWCTWKSKKAFLDMAVIGRFVDVDYVAQRELARCIGTTPEVVLHNLVELLRCTLCL
jgi:cleavage and polyadenylation specificity factor subunit 1